MTHSYKRCSGFGLLVLAGILFSSQALAIDVQLFRPENSHGEGLTVRGSSTLHPGDIHGGLFINWVKNPLEIAVIGNDDRLDDVVNWFATANVLLSAGVTNWLSLEIDVPFNFSNNIEELGTTTDEKDLSMGDILTRATIRLRDKVGENGNQIGFAIVPFFTLPTGEEGDFMGNSNVTGGLKLVADRWFGKNYLAVNAGFRGREREIIQNLNINHELTGGIGYVRKLWEDANLDLFAEIFSSTTSRDFLSREVTSPAELVGGIRKGWMDNRLAMTLGAGRGLNNGYGSPDFRIFSGVTYAFRSSAATTSRVTDADSAEGEEEVVEETPVEEPVFVSVESEGEQIQIVEKVYFGWDDASIRADGMPVLEKITQLLNSNPEAGKLLIQAHADSQGPAEYNLHLSQRRAESVKKYLVSNGVPSERLVTQWFGEEQPAASNDTPEGRAENRRADFEMADSEENAKDKE